MGKTADGENSGWRKERVGKTTDGGKNGWEKEWIWVIGLKGYNRRL
jgi:hypothetical protein